VTTYLSHVILYYRRADRTAVRAGQGTPFSRNHDHLGGHPTSYSRRTRRRDTLPRLAKESADQTSPASLGNTGTQAQEKAQTSDCERQRTGIAHERPGGHGYISIQTSPAAGVIVPAAIDLPVIKGDSLPRSWKIRTRRCTRPRKAVAASNGRGARHLNLPLEECCYVSDRKEAGQRRRVPPAWVMPGPSTAPLADDSAGRRGLPDKEVAAWFDSTVSHHAGIAQWQSAAFIRRRSWGRSPFSVRAGNSAGQSAILI
jgi:hypothetical protein